MTQKLFLLVCCVCFMFTSLHYQPPSSHKPQHHQTVPKETDMYFRPYLSSEGFTVIWHSMPNSTIANMNRPHSQPIKENMPILTIATSKSKGEHRRQHMVTKGCSICLSTALMPNTTALTTSIYIWASCSWQWVQTMMQGCTAHNTLLPWFGIRHLGWQTN